MNKLLRFFRKKKGAVKSNAAGKGADEPVPVNEYISAEQRAADEEITERYKRLRDVGPFVK